MHEFPKNLINDMDALRDTLNQIYPGGYELKMDHPTVAIVQCTKQDPGDLKTFLQEAGVILIASP